MYIWRWSSIRILKRKRSTYNATASNSDNLKRIKISAQTRELYEKRDKSLDNADPDAPVLPPEMWENAVVAKYYRPRKTAVSVRLDNDVLAWLRSQGSGYLSRINEILRREMLNRR